jgi:hypothetical protein
LKLPELRDELLLTEPEPAELRDELPEEKPLLRPLNDEPLLV